VVAFYQSIANRYPSDIHITVSEDGENGAQFIITQKSLSTNRYLKEIKWLKLNLKSESVFMQFSMNFLKSIGIFV